MVDFLATKSPQAASKAQFAIADQLEKIREYPMIYRPVEGMPGQRDSLLSFGSYGYVIRYEFDSKTDFVLILRVWHQLEH